MKYKQYTHSNRLSRLGYTTSITFVFQYYYSIKEISVGGRCVCNGHAFVCPPSAEDPDLLQCQCQHNTAGLNCDKCAEGYVQKRYVGISRHRIYQIYSSECCQN